MSHFLDNSGRIVRSPFFWTGLLKLFAPRDDHASSGVFVILIANEDAYDLFMFSLITLLCLELQTASAKENVHLYDWTAKFCFYFENF